MAVEVRDSGLQGRQFLDDELIEFVVCFKSVCVLLSLLGHELTKNKDIVRRPGAC